jgi:hypothetical protein
LLYNEVYSRVRVKMQEKKRNSLWAQAKASPKYHGRYVFLFDMVTDQPTRNREFHHRRLRHLHYERVNYREPRPEGSIGLMPRFSVINSYYSSNLTRFSLLLIGWYLGYNPALDIQGIDAGQV